MPASSRRNILILTLSQALMLSAIVLSMALAAILGAMLAPDKGFGTLPVAASFAGTRIAHRAVAAASPARGSAS